MYLELKGELARKGQTFKTMAVAIKRPYSYVCRCASGKSCFDFKAGYATLDWLGLPHSELQRIFPPNG